MALIDQYWLSKDATFVSRVQMAMVEAAIAVSSEDPAADYHNVRATWATQVLRDPEHYASRVATGVAGNPAITAASTDNDIKFTVNSQWNAFAGVVTVEPAP